MRNLFTLITSLFLMFVGTIVAHAQKVGIFIGYESVSQIVDDDEKAAAEWFQQNYPEGVVVTPTTTDKIAELTTLWIPVDRLGISQGWKNLPAAYRSDKVIAAITNHVKAGGCLYLTTHATQLVVGIGRVSDTYAPGIFGAGEGGMNPDIWGINAQIGCNPDLANQYDHRSHPIYNGLSTNSSLYTDHEIYPLIGNGWKEDHNCKWDFNGIAGLEDAPNKLADFEDKTNSSVIGAWQHVTDYACAGVIEFKPEGEYKGTVLCNGIAAYEFNENDAPNIYQDNIDLLTKNSIDYLTSVSKKVSTAISQVIAQDGNKDANVYYTISGARVVKPTIPGVYVVNHKKVVIK